jgi:hypothetical protein
MEMKEISRKAERQAVINRIQRILRRHWKIMNNLDALEEEIKGMVPNEKKMGNLQELIHYLRAYQHYLFNYEQKKRKRVDIDRNSRAGCNKPGARLSEYGELVRKYPNESPAHLCFNHYPETRGTSVEARRLRKEKTGKIRKAREYQSKKEREFRITSSKEGS